MALPLGSWETINRRLPRLYGEFDTEKHARIMLEVLNELVPAEAVVLKCFDTCKPQAFGILSENHPIPQRALIAQYSHESPCYMCDKTQLDRPGLGMFGIRHLILGVLGVVDGVNYSIALSRAREAFTEYEREVLNVLHPHLVTSFINAAASSRANSSLKLAQMAMETAPGAYGYFDTVGKVSWMQEKAKVWLHEFFGDEASDEDNVPHSLRQLLQEAIRTGDVPRPVEKVAGDECMIVCLGSLAVGGWILRLERKSRRPLPAFRPLPQFNERQNEVLRWMIEGKTNAEIGLILGLSSRTIEKYVHAILAEFQVENRATAIVRAMECCAAMNHGPPTPALAEIPLEHNPILALDTYEPVGLQTGRR